MYKTGEVFRRPGGTREYTIIGPGEYRRFNFAGPMQVYPVLTDQGKNTTLTEFDLRYMSRSTRGKGRPIRKRPLKIQEGGTAVSASTLASRLAVVESRRTEASRAIVAMEEAIQASRNELKVDPVPQDFIGTVRDYRYRSGGVDEMPRHTMRVDVDPTMTLWVSVPSTMFEKYIVFKMKAKAMSKLNGKLILCRRNSQYGLLPIDLLPDPYRKDDGTYIKDIYDRVLYREAKVFATDFNDSGVVQEYVGSNVLRVQLDRFDDTSDITSSTLIRV